MNHGFRVRIQFNSTSPFIPSAIWLRNVTEIHWGYRPGMVAFESDVHLTGITYNIEYINEFEATTETEIAEGF